MCSQIKWQNVTIMAVYFMAYPGQATKITLTSVMMYEHVP